jgi:hypothetical protein
MFSKPSVVTVIIIVRSTDVVMQWADTQIPVCTQRSRYCWAITMEMAFPMWSVPRCYKQDSLKERVSCWVKLPAVQLNKVT